MPLAFFPDAPESTPEVIVELEAIPTARGYGGAPGQVSAGYAALAAACTGAALLQRLDGNARVIAGTQTKLYEGSGSSWTDVSRAGNYTTGDVRWRFAQFGNTSLAINKATQLQFSNSGAFANVANSPKASLMESVAGGFIMLADCDDTGTGLATGFGDQPNRWWCSQAFAPTLTWAPSPTTLATSGLLVDAPGPITALRRLGDACIAYKKRALYVGQNVGGPGVWQWNLVPGEIGTPCNEAVVSIGTSHLFIGFEDIYQFDGTRPVSIGGGIKEWFFARLNKTYSYLIQSQHDFNNQLVYWHYPSGQSTTLDSAIVYNYRTQKWGALTMDVECVVNAVTGTVTYDSLGTLFATYADIPSIAYDSPFWQSGAPVMSMFNMSHVLYSLTGTTGAWSLTTGYMGDDSQVSTCTRVRPRYGVTPTTAFITPRGVMALGDTATVGSISAINGNRFDVLQSWRYHGFTISGTGNFELQAITPTLVADGDE